MNHHLVQVIGSSSPVRRDALPDWPDVRVVTAEPPLDIGHKLAVSYSARRARAPPVM